MRLFKTPLRYPGGKQKLAPFFSEILASNKLLGGHYVETYAGGAGAAIELLLTKQVSHIHLNDSCYPIYCFWQSIIKETDNFCKLIQSASLTVKEWRKQKNILVNSQDYSMLEVG